MAIKYSEDFESYAVGTSLIGVGDQQYTLRFQGSVFDVIAGKKGSVSPSGGNGWNSCTCNAAALATLADYTLSLDVSDFSGGRLVVGFRSSAGGSYWLQWIGVLELILYKCPSWDFLNGGQTIVHDWTVTAPATLSHLDITVSGTSITVVIDGTTFGPINDASNASGTIGFTAFLDSLEIDNIVVSTPSIPQNPVPESNYDKFLKVYEKPTAKIYRELYMKRKGVDGALESDWQQIDNKYVIEWGSYEINVSEVLHTNYTASGPNMKFDNTDGFFNDETSRGSFFHGYGNRKYTMVKILTGYFNDDNSKALADDVAFVGVIGESISNESNNTISIQMENLDYIFTMNKTKDLDGIYTTTGDVIDHIVNTVYHFTNGSGTYTFRQYFTQACWYAYGDIAGYANTLSTETVGDGTIKDFINEISTNYHMYFYADRKGNLVTLRPGENINYFYKDKVIYSIPSDCLFHNRMEYADKYTVYVDTTTLSIYATSSSAVDILDSVKGENVITNYWNLSSEDLTKWTYTSAAVKFGNGFSFHAEGTLTGGATGLYRCLGGFGTETLKRKVDGCFNKFTAEMWIKTTQTISAGALTNGNSFYLFNLDAVSYFNSFKQLFFGLGLNAQIYGRDGFSNAIVVASITSMTYAPNDIFFLAFTYDINGINGSDNVAKLFIAPDGGNIELAGTISKQNIVYNSAIYGGGTLSTASIRTFITGLNYASTRYKRTNTHNTTGSKTISQFGLMYQNTATASNFSLIVDNYKVYNYAKESFEDRHYEYGYSKIDRMELNQGNILKGFSFNYPYANVYNSIRVKFDPADTTTSYVTKEEIWTQGDGSSSDKYGVRHLDIDISTKKLNITAQDLADYYYDKYKNLRREAELRLKYNIYIGPTEVLPMNYQTFNSCSAQAFSTTAFTGAFGSNFRNIDERNSYWEVVKVAQDFDKLETKLTVREVV